jgi:hypothetical protein
MVKVKDPSDFDRLEAVMRDTCLNHGLKLYVTGWTRKTYDVFLEGKTLSKAEHMARVESLAMKNGEIRFFDDRAIDFAHALGEALEDSFPLKEAVLIREKRPEY